MQLLSNLKQGTLKIKVTSPDDLWHLSQIILPQDIISAQTERKIKLGEEKTVVVKRTVMLNIRIEKIEFSEQALRVSGKIIEGKEDISAGSYHTIILEQGIVFSLTKEQWPHYQIERLKEASTETKPPILIVVFDREEAFIAILKRTGTEILTHLQGEVTRKRMQTKINVKSFYLTIIEAIKSYDERFKLSNILLASPSFWKEELQKELNDQNIKKKIILTTCSSVDESAINEVLSREETRNTLAAFHTTKELSAVEKLLTEIARKSENIVYGIKEVQQAADSGAIKELLITDTLITNYQEKGTYQSIDSLLKTVDNAKGTITIISGKHSGGKKLNGLGGIAAFLRYFVPKE